MCSQSCLPLSSRVNSLVRTERFLTLSSQGPVSTKIWTGRLCLANHFQHESCCTKVFELHSCIHTEPQGINFIAKIPNLNLAPKMKEAAFFYGVSPFSIFLFSLLLVESSVHPGGTDIFSLLENWARNGLCLFLDGWPLTCSYKHGSQELGTLCLALGLTPLKAVCVLGHGFGNCDHFWLCLLFLKTVEWTLAHTVCCYL